MEKDIKEFIVEEAEVTDVFCFQEVYTEARKMFENILTGWNAAYAHKKLSTHADFPLATYVKKDMRLISSETILGDVSGVGLGLYTEIEGKRGTVNICNFYGIAYPVRDGKCDEKLDNPERTLQSKTLIDFFCSLRGPKVIGGDFNLMPDIESIRVSSKNEYVDLIKEWNIQTTRNRLSWEMYPGHKQNYSDYVFVSSDVHTKNFAVPQNEVSDHLPMILDIAD